MKVKHFLKHRSIPWHPEFLKPQCVSNILLEMNPRSPEQMCDAKWLPNQLHHLDLYELFYLSNTRRVGYLCFSGLKILPWHWIWNLLILMQGWFQYMEALYNPESSGVKKEKKSLQKQSNWLVKRRVVHCFSSMYFKNSIW